LKRAMGDWEYCQKALPKVSRTFALNISVLKGDLHRSILTTYLFCRIIDTIEDAAQLDPKIKIKLLHEFSRLIQDVDYRRGALASWVRECEAVDGSPNDLELLSHTLREKHTERHTHRERETHNETGTQNHSERATHTERETLTN